MGIPADGSHDTGPDPGDALTEDIWLAARACRAAIDGEFYGGNAPSDSNALTEAWPTRDGAGFIIGRGSSQHADDDTDIAVLIVPLGKARDMIHPCWLEDPCAHTAGPATASNATTATDH